MKAREKWGLLMLNTSLISKYCLCDLLNSKSSIRDQLTREDDFAVPGPDRPKPIYNTDWRQMPSIPPRRGKHYDNIKVGPPIVECVYPPTIFFGRLFRIIWGENPILEISQSSIDVNDYLPICLHPSPLPTLTDYIKHKTLCAKPIIWIIRRSQVQPHPKYRSANEKSLIDELPIDQKYNFTLLGDGRLVFTRIPHSKFKYPYRLLSKHVALAKRSSNVRFAGELRKTDNGETLLIKNNSGTYKPDDKMTPSAVAYFQQLFPHLYVRGIPRD
ncbi:unnamed protein product [Rotaria sordida]|uniref:Uncharacterized protein n=2 Tax=Rotaria sordida TaxID=392033 RepID=A0A813VBQ1_9BILA|nr:unnamed protein product [Rotaria sordida]CAF0859862.1 unnamed protein product [Rotaria sordida]